MKKLFFLLLTAVCALLYGPPANAWIVYLDQAPLKTKYGDTVAPRIHLWNSEDATYTEWDNESATMDDNGDGRWYFDDTMVTKSDAPSGTPTYCAFIVNGKAQSVPLNGSHNFHDGYTYIWDGGDQRSAVVTWELRKNHTDNIKQVKVNRWDARSLPLYTTISSAPFILDYTQAGIRGGKPIPLNHKVALEVSFIDGSASKTYYFDLASGEFKEFDENTESNFRALLDSSILYTKVNLVFEDNVLKTYTLSETVYDNIQSISLVARNSSVGTVALANDGGNLWTCENIANDEGAQYYFTVNTARSSDESYSIPTSAYTATEPVTAGDYPLAKTYNPVTVSGLAALNIAVTTEGAAPTAINISDANAVIEAISINNWAGEVGRFGAFTTTDGVTWTWNGRVNQCGGYEDSSNDAQNYYITTTLSGEQQKWGVFAGKSFGLAAGYTFCDENKLWNSVWTATSDTQKYGFRFTDQSEVKVTITLTPNKKELQSISYAYEPYVTPRTETYMPLKRSDFQKGPRYFLVGNRTADWRLLPEWELSVNATGSEATLSGRMMYLQCFGIAKVDTYDDYVKHIYELYTYSGTSGYDVNGDAHTDIPLSHHYRTGAMLYTTGHTATATNDETHVHWNHLLWKVRESGFTGGEGGTLTMAKPTLLKKVTLKLKDSNGNALATPTLSFNYSTDDREIFEATTMTLVGENIKYEGGYAFPDGKLIEMDEIGLKASNAGSVIKGWDNAWIQSDASGRPYIDGYGNTLYNTAYDKEWLDSHFVNFYNSSEDVPYSSKNVTFLPYQTVLAQAQTNGEADDYAELYKAHPYSVAGTANQIGNNQQISLNYADEAMSGQIKFRYKEKLTDYGHNTARSFDNDGWQCYVVKDMWIEGPLKVWTGSGGNLKKYDGIGHDDDESKNNTQWFYENGGHNEVKKDHSVVGGDVEYSPNTVNEVDVYGTTHDRNAANFKVDDLTYFNRVLLWYHPTLGFDRSVLQFIQSSCGPNILASRNPDKRNTLRYNWWIHTSNGTDGDLRIVSYRINRYRQEGSREILDKENVASVTSLYESVDDHDTSHKVTMKDDVASLEPGQYFYRIYVMFSDGKTKQATSNIVPIERAATPVDLAVTQPMDDQNRYTFNLKVTAAPAEDQMDRAAGTDGKTVKELMKKYVVTISDEAHAMLEDIYRGIAETKIEINGKTTSSLPWKQAILNGVMIGKDQYLDEGTWYYEYLIPEDRSDLSKLSLEMTFHNVQPTITESGAPLKLLAYDTYIDDEGHQQSQPKYADYDKAEYAFTAYLVCDENTTDLQNWEYLNFDAAKASAGVVAPTAPITLDNLRVQMSSSETFSGYIKPRDHDDYPSGGRLNDYTQDEAYGWWLNGYKVEDPFVYRDYNEIAATVKVDALPVADEVKENYAITYNIVVIPSTVDYAANFDNPLYSPSLPHTDVDPQLDLSMEIFDLDLSAVGTTKSLDGAGAYIDGEQLSTTFDAYFVPCYQRINYFTLIGDAVYNTDGKPDIDRELALSLQRPTLEQEGATFSKYVHKKWYEENGIGWHDIIGTYLHAQVGMKVSGYLDENSPEGLYPYIGFHAQQHVHYCPTHNGLYPWGHNTHGCMSDHEASSPMGQWTSHAVAPAVGTRAANGGHPIGRGWDQSVTSVVAPLAYDGVEYVDFGTDPELPSDPTIENYNWSRLAARSGRLPIHINPIKQLTGYMDDPDETPVKQEDVNGADVTIQMAAVYPVIRTGSESNRPYLISKARTASASPVRNSFGASKFDLIAVKSEDHQVDFSTAIPTGVESVSADGWTPYDGPTEYYNIMGIRVDNPVKGEIYIVKQGSKVRKVLYQ